MIGVFLNNTQGTSNPGCQGTSHLLITGLTQSGLRIYSECPIGYDDFTYKRVTPPASNPSKKERILSCFGIPSYKPLFNLSTSWGVANSSMVSKFSSLWREADTIVLNGEGTIHHAGVGALTLMGFCKIAKDLGKKVFVLNCSSF
jgi:hypothetical protein